MRRIWLVAGLLMLLAGAFGLLAGAASAQSREVIVVDVNGAIDQVTARYMERAIEAADRDAVEAIVFRLDTPGGQLDATRDIVKDILDSRVPVIVYVAPSGARAASAGTFIAAAAGVAAMAPTTNIGAASPVAGGGEELPETLSKKAQQDAAALIRSIAERRGRNSEALEATVFEATAYSAEEALANDVIDVIAADVRDLLEKVDGMTIATASRDEVVQTANAAIRELRPNLVERALGFLADPNVAFLLFSLGGLAILVEFWTPGTFGPAIVGIILLLLAFAGLGNLPFSWAGVALIVLAMVLFFVESQVPGFGLFGIAGVAALVLGGVFLVGFFGAPGIPEPEIRVSWWTLAGVAGAVGLIVLWFVRELRVSRKLPGYHSQYSSSELVGKAARVTRALEPEGEVTIAGEFWTARLPKGVSAQVGAEVTVKGVVGLVLEVELQTATPPEAPPEPAR